MKTPDALPHSPPALFYMVAVASLLAEISAVLSLGNDPYGIFIAAGLHVGAMVLICLWASQAWRRNYDRFGLFLLPLTAAGGPFGAGIALLAAMVYTRCVSDATSPVEWIADLFSRHQDRESDRLHERIELGLDDFESAASVEPFRDILSGGGVLQKQMAIAKIARYFRPVFAPLLLQAARDPNAAVRVQAATALAKIERDFMARYIRLENELRDLPDHDPAKLKLAELYDDYAHADLLDENNRQSLRLKAIGIYEACLAQEDNSDWRLKLARLYLRDGQPEKTCEWLKPLVESPDMPRGATLWYMEALFQLKKFGELRQLASYQVPIIRISSDASLGEIENLPGVWEGTGVWEGKAPVLSPSLRKAAS
jgi:polysaccharide biosynthesis protein PelE